jgi:hypothetical protein
MTAARGRLGAYAWWQLRDYVLGPGAGTLFLVGLVSLAPIFGMRRAMGVAAGPEAMADMVRVSFLAMVQFLALVGPIVAVGSMVSADRAPGLARFLFAKPISVSRFYLQMWLVRGAGLLAITAVLALTVDRLAAPVPWLAAVGGIALTWLLLGGVGYLASVLAPRDSIYVIGCYALTTLLDQFRSIAPQWAWVDGLLTVLPPMHKLGPLRNALLAGQGWSWPDAWHVMGWGAACVVLATVLVRRLPQVR